jgi:hypothetical protein
MIPKDLRRLSKLYKDTRPIFASTAYRIYGGGNVVFGQTRKAPYRKARGFSLA